jgi:hypothetical protein
MKIVCVWCSKDMGTIPSEYRPKSVITHGICEECVSKIFVELGTELGVFLDSLAAPVLVVDETGNVVTANRQTRALLQKELPDIEHYKGGDVFECAYAKLPEGCGKTIHCDGCTIRNTIMDTFQSGKSHLKTPAYLNRGTPDDCKKIDFLISTEKVNGVVLLRIDKVSGNEEIQP